MIKYLELNTIWVCGLIEAMNVATFDVLPPSVGHFKFSSFCLKRATLVARQPTISTIDAPISKMMNGT